MPGISRSRRVEVRETLDARLEAGDADQEFGPATLETHRVELEVGKRGETLPSRRETKWQGPRSGLAKPPHERRISPVGLTCRYLLLGYGRYQGRKELPGSRQPQAAEAALQIPN